MNSDKAHRSRDKSPYIVRLFPSMVTMLGVCSGLTSIKCTFGRQWESAVLFIIVAAVVDGIDGRIARLLKSESGFGAQLDSLADFLSFGVAPAFLMYFWVLCSMKVVGWMLVMIFVICISIRLARFNVAMYEEEETEDWRKFFFVGVPAPIGAGLSIIPVMLTFSSGSNTWLSNAGILNTNVVALYFLFVAFLSVSNIPTISAKHSYIPRRLSYTFMMLLAILMVLAVTHPWITFPIMGLVYMLSIPVSGVYYAYLSNGERSRIDDEDKDK